MACHYGHLIICVALSHLMQFKETALHMAYASGHVEVAATLLKHGAIVDKEDMVSLGKKRSYVITFNDVMSLCSHWLIYSSTVPPGKHGSCVL